MGPWSLLIAEADAMQRQMLDVLFAVDGFELTMVERGADALAHLREHTPSAVILASDLPDVPGATICQRLKSVRRLSQVPVVLVAPEPRDGGGIPEALRGEAHAAGADLLVQKPLGDKNLRERVQRLITAPLAETGLAPPAVNTTSVLEVGAVLGAAAPATTGGPRPASELGALRAEVARLREENEQLRSRLSKFKVRVKEMQEELEATRRRPRGLFGRRA